MYIGRNKVLLSLGMLGAVDDHCLDLLIHQELQNSAILLFLLHLLSGFIKWCSFG